MQLEKKSLLTSPSKTILLSGLVAGTLDLLTALIVYAVLLHQITAENILRGIASGIFRNSAFTGGPSMVIFGIVFHFMIALAFALFYFWIYPYLLFVQKQKIIAGLLYGIFVWLVMNGIVLPLIFTHPAPLTWHSFGIGAPILMIMVGLPVSIITHSYFSSGTKKG